MESKFNLEGAFGEFPLRQLHNVFRSEDLAVHNRFITSREINFNSQDWVPAEYQYFQIQYLVL